MSEPTLDQSQSRLLGALTLIALKHLGVDTLVVDEENSLCPDWRMARIGDVALLEKPADSRSPKRIDCYQVMERSVGATAFKFDPARLVYSLRRLHRAEPPDCRFYRNPRESDQGVRLRARLIWTCQPWVFSGGGESDLIRRLYLRHTTIRKDGKRHRYRRLVRSVRVGRRVIHQTVAQLSELDEDGRIEAQAFAHHGACCI
jgi:hypothetical protein